MTEHVCSSDFDDSSKKRQVDANGTICKTTDDAVASIDSLTSFRNDRPEIILVSTDYTPAGGRVKSYLDTAKTARLDAIESKTETQNESMMLHRRQFNLVHEHSTTVTSVTGSQETSAINTMRNHSASMV